MLKWNCRNSRIELALGILEPGKNWNINETCGFDIIEVSTNTKKSWQTLKIGRVLFQAHFQDGHFQDGRHRPYWKMNFWYIGPTSMCNMSLLTILMVINPFSILFLQFEVYFTLYSNTDYFKWMNNWLCLKQLWC